MYWITVSWPNCCEGAHILALVAPGELFGGAERQILTLCHQLRARGRRFVVFLFHDRLLAERLRESGCIVEILSVRGPGYILSARHLARRFGELGVRVVHVHGYKAAFHVYLAKRRFDVAVLKTEHGRPELYASSLGARAKVKLFAAVDAIATRSSRASMVYVTQELRDFFRPVYGALAGSVIYNGLEPLSRESTSRPQSYLPNDFNVVVVGRLEPVKALDLAIDALLLPAASPRVRLHIVGDGPLRAQLELATRRRGLQSRVLYHGFCANVHDYIAHADVLLISSLHEGLPYTVLEAMALRTPVIAASVGGLREVLINERTAILFEPGNVSAIAAALAQAEQDASLLVRLSAAALADVEQRFSAEAMAGAYCALYDQLATGQ